MFHEDQTINVTPRVLTRKTAPPPGGHIFQGTGTIFRVNRATIETNVMTKFHEDWTINVTSRVLTSKTAPPPGGHIFNGPEPFSISAKILLGQIFELNQDIIGTNLLTMFHEDQTINAASRVLTRQNVDDG
ncbi:hypothetical protein DPMN_170866 [Dreissena polymorpha]|uniref:Uncharacterized protein n=1 Tax=Dreissena polymorpha TaxID=45954 RepID=A0A9D4IF01_DREPO|nr:hypothetical protein DPMN_170866 [Dreissena polymorpha]